MLFFLVTWGLFNLFLQKQPGECLALSRPWQLIYCKITNLIQASSRVCFKFHSTCWGVVHVYILSLRYCQWLMSCLVPITAIIINYNNKITYFTVSCLILMLKMLIVFPINGDKFLLWILLFYLQSNLYCKVYLNSRFD